MKIAVATDSHGKISKHFGRAPFYQLFTIEDDQIVATQQVDKAGPNVVLHEADEPHEHEHEHRHEHGHDHSQMIAPIRDCAALIAGGMGSGAYNALNEANVTPILTDQTDPEAAVRAYVDGTLANRTDLVH